MSQPLQPTILVIVGISGDLSKRYLLPAIRKISEAEALPKDFRIVGISRRQLQLTDVVPSDDDFWSQYVELHQMDLDDAAAYKTLAAKLTTVEESLGGSAQRLFYLSVPPDAVPNVVQKLGQSGLAEVPDTKLLLEKPFGADLSSAQILVDRLKEQFAEEQVYRIDHYLAKEMAQNLIIFRASNPLFAHTWNKDFIASIEITMAETIGIEGRTTFYEQTGALRDVVQSHLLQLAALTLMNLPKTDDWHAVPSLRLQALQAIRPVQDVARQAERGQYQGYREEVNNPRSTVETFVRMQLTSDDEHWRGVPITVMAGKALNRRCTEIRVRYKADTPAQANFVTLRIQPDEGVEVCLWLKKPGYDRELELKPLSFAYKQQSNVVLAEAYERVFVDAMRSDHSLFTTSEEVLATWKILEPVQQAWQQSSTELFTYPVGSALEGTSRPATIKP